MSNNEQRDELARIALDAMFPSKSDLPDDPMTWPSSTFKTADAILAAGYRKPRTITTYEELDALAVGSIVLDGDVCVRRAGGYWKVLDLIGVYTSRDITIPAAVLHEPTTEATK